MIKDNRRYKNAIKNIIFAFCTISFLLPTAINRDKSQGKIGGNAKDRIKADKTDGVNEDCVFRTKIICCHVFVHLLYICAFQKNFAPFAGYWTVKCQ